MSFSDRIDDAIAFVSPRWAASRKADRVALAQISRLSSDTSPGRLNTDTPPRSTDPNYGLELLQDRRSLVDRARSSDEGNVLAGAILDRSTEVVVGEGFRLRATTADPAWNKQAEALWDEWAAEADDAGLSTLGELEQLHYRGKKRDGDAGFALLDNGRVRLVESDEIADPSGPYSRPLMVDGVELDERRRPVAFHVHRANRDTIWADRRYGPAERIPREQFVFAAGRKRANQVRGQTSFKGLFWLLDHAVKTLEAGTISNYMAACLGLVLKKSGGGTAGLPTTTDAAGNTRKKLRLEPGSIMTLGVGEEAMQITPSSVSSAGRDHIRELERLMTTRFPVTLEMVLGDYTASNLSNSRNSRMEARERAKIEQGAHARTMTTLYLWKLIHFMEAGLLAPRADALSHKWRRPAWPLVEPVAELQASQAAIDSGLSTRSIEADRLGYDFEDELVPQLAHEQGLLDAAGIGVVRSTLTRDPVPPGAAPLAGAGTPPTDAPPTP